MAGANCPSLIIRYIWDRASGALRRADAKLIVASIRVTVRSLCSVRARCALNVSRICAAVSPVSGKRWKSRIVVT